MGRRICKTKRINRVHVLKNWGTLGWSLVDCRNKNLANRQIMAMYLRKIEVRTGNVNTHAMNRATTEQASISFANNCFTFIPSNSKAAWARTSRSTANTICGQTRKPSPVPNETTNHNVISAREERRSTGVTVGFCGVGFSWAYKIKKRKWIKSIKNYRQYCTVEWLWWKCETLSPILCQWHW